MRIPVTLGLLALNLGLGAVIVEVVTGEAPVANGDPSRVAVSIPIMKARSDGSEMKEDISPGSSMFGLSLTESSPDDTTRLQPRPSYEATYRLVGIMLSSGGKGTSSTIILLQHGSPPIVSRFALGASFEGWRLAAATRTEATLINNSGQHLSLELQH